MRILQSLSALVVLAVTATTVVGCSSERDGKSASGSRGLMGVLDSAPAAVSGTTVSYLNVRTARALVKKDEKLYANFNGYGIPEYASVGYTSKSLRTLMGFDERDVQTSLVVGDLSNRLTGDFDKDAISKALAKRDYRAEKSGRGLRLSNGKDRQYEVTGDVLVGESKKEGLSPLAPEGKTLADDSLYKAVAKCLGSDVYEANFFGKERPRAISRLFAVGGRIGNDGAPSETLCALATNDEKAQEIAKRLRTETTKGKRYAGTEVSVTEGDMPMVTMTWKNTSASGMHPADELKFAILLMHLVK
ncbi:hypothetical protein HRW16_08740 [Streptomyces lunaelactis]|uniref:hypothetical protein n=1 Tax=Streptomyces lunaelactis TaxID=1535768 RepID=UPI0015856772|nr:hypothetical protein [Streptomyces lunaelactis]NUK34422.1 hypothetical protein [Streptomyces lunaelactis]NUK44123.1 hypothetical protein [Streptomyces lunaelactis]NUK91944.1 hypothetical protein [Streptomyces lunaelactis]NUL33669.1 hypothetical protein [Streptomyces lunaelactis]